MQIQVRNYRRVERADIEASPIALVAGRNEQGKTSLLQAVQAALTGSGTVKAGATKKDASALLRRGADEGLCRVMDEDAEASMSWPKCTATGTGLRASAIAVGVIHPVDMNPAERSLLLVGLLDAMPGKPDLAAAMKDAGYSDGAVDKLWKAIEADGWDAVLKKAKDSHTVLRGRWEQAANDHFGEVKAAGWVPEGWTPDIAEADPAALEQAAKDAAAALERAIASGAVDAAEIGRLENDTMLDATLNLADLRQAVDAARAELERCRAERAALPPADPGEDTVSCPACSVPLTIDTPYKGKPSLKLAQKVSESELKKRRMAVAEADGKAENAVGAVTLAQKALAEAEALAQTAKSAREKLAAAKAKGGDGGGDTQAAVQQAREAKALADQRVAMRSRRDTAAAIFTQWSQQAKLIAALAPEGLRRAKLGKALGGFNETLAGLCATAKWPVVQLDEALDLHYGTWRVADLSESAEMRARIVVQIAVALLDRSAIVVIDRADLLDAAGRNGLFSLLASVSDRLRALVAMTMNKPDLVPDLAAAGMGAAYWIEDGRTEAVAKLKEAA